MNGYTGFSLCMELYINNDIRQIAVANETNEEMISGYVPVYFTE